MLFESGEADFVLDQYRACWGWALGEGRTTWVEVFDTRWTHCHQWAGAPTWQAEGDRIRYTVSAPSEAIEIVTDRGERIRVKPFATRTVYLKDKM